MSEKIAVLGCTGSIGTQTLEIARKHSQDFEVVALSAYNNIQKITEQVEIFQPAFCAIAEANCQGQINEKKYPRTKFVYGEFAAETVAREADYSRIVVASSGLNVLPAVIEAVKRGKTLCLATKEVMVAAGEWVLQLAKECGARILPVDSEHSAIFQCLIGHESKEIKRLILTASGGPFFGKSRAELAKVTLLDTLKHPNWNMGKKITVDCATLMNKGLEVIEAKWLFHLEPSCIDTIVHPQSIIHSMVELIDGTVLAQMSYPTMEIPIQLALSYPRRLTSSVKPLDFEGLKSLTFHKLERKMFPCYDLCLCCMEQGGVMPVVVNAANEVLVQAFLEQKISFLDIGEYLAKIISGFVNYPIDSFEAVYAADTEARVLASQCFSSEKK